MIIENWDVCRMRFDCTDQVYMYLNLSVMLLKSKELLDMWVWLPIGIPIAYLDKISPSFFKNYKLKILTQLLHNFKWKGVYNCLIYCW